MAGTSSAGGAGVVAPLGELVVFEVSLPFSEDGVEATFLRTRVLLKRRVLSWVRKRTLTSVVEMDQSCPVMTSRRRRVRYEMKHVIDVTLTVHDHIRRKESSAVHPCPSYVLPIGILLEMLDETLQEESRNVEEGSRCSGQAGKRHDRPLVGCEELQAEIGRRVALDSPRQERRKHHSSLLYSLTEVCEDSRRPETCWEDWQVTDFQALSGVAQHDDCRSILEEDNPC